MLFGEPNSTQFEDLPPKFIFVKDIVPQDTNPFTNDEVILEAVMDVVELHHALGFNCIPPYTNLEEVVVPKGIDHFFEEFYLPTFPMEDENDTPT